MQQSSISSQKHLLNSEHTPSPVTTIKRFTKPMSSTFSSLHIILIFLVINSKGISGATFTLVNRCNHIVWPGTLANAGSAKLDSTGFELPPGESRSFQAPPSWSGRFWGRSGCTFDPATGQGTCTTGDCGSNQLECNGAGATPPATLAEFTIGSGPNSGAQDFYDVSLVDGYNLAMMVEASGGSGACGTTGCATDLNRLCPNELRGGEGQSCKSACEAFGSPEYCCIGAYGSPSTCRPSMYSQIFKSACPRAYSYAYDDATSIFTCTGADYTITFCPSSTSQKSSRDSPSNSTNGPPVATGAVGAVGNSSSTGSQAENPDPFTSWLPNFTTGDSSRTISDYGLHSTSISSIIITFALLSLLQS